MVSIYVIIIVTNIYIGTHKNDLLVATTPCSQIACTPPSGTSGLRFTLVHGALAALLFQAKIPPVAGEGGSFSHTRIGVTELMIRTLLM